MLTVAAGLAAAAPAGADVRIMIHNGRVSLVAIDATLRQILAEWAKVGQTTIVNSERVPGGLLTLQLTDLPEAQALDILLRALSGYIAVQRVTPVAGLSRFDRIVVMPTVAAPISGGASTTARSRFPQPIAPASEALEQEALPVALVRENYPVEDEVNWNRIPQPVRQPLSVPFVRENYPADDEVGWNRGPEPVPQPPPVPFVREDYPADDEVNWNPLLATGGVPGASSTPNGRSTGQRPLVLPPGGGPAASPRDSPGMATVPAGVAVPGMPTPAPVPRQPTQQVVPPDDVVL